MKLEVTSKKDMTYEILSKYAKGICDN